MIISMTLLIKVLCVLRKNYANYPGNKRLSEEKLGRSSPWYVKHSRIKILQTGFFKTSPSVSFKPFVRQRWLEFPFHFNSVTAAFHSWDYWNAFNEIKTLPANNPQITSVRSRDNKKFAVYKLHNNSVSARSEVRPDNSEFISIASGDQTCIMDTWFLICHFHPGRI